MSHTCKTCGANANEPGHLCNPCGDKIKCGFCGTADVDARHMCTGKLSGIKFICGECGRMASAPGLLCKPNQIIDSKSAF